MGVVFGQGVGYVCDFKVFLFYVGFRLIGKVDGVICQVVYCVQNDGSVNII